MTNNHEYDEENKYEVHDSLHQKLANTAENGTLGALGVTVLEVVSDFNFPLAATYWDETGFALGFVFITIGGAKLMRDAFFSRNRKRDY